MEEVEVVVLIHPHHHILLCPVLQVHRVAADQNHYLKDQDQFPEELLLQLH
jgi:hypothetical protein